ncbi:zf-TFIIB domain-containing protein, partial [bacterium]|nr:zf-TFIIB domain-containing protein [bacterium]
NIQGSAVQSELTRAGGYRQNTMKCPRCKKTLIVVEREKIELDYCMNCKGFWFDQDEWNFLPEALNLNIEFPDFSTYPRFKIKEIDTRCPHCTKTMEQIYLGKNDNSEAQDVASVILDICPQGHGIWFDPNELGKVLSVLLHKSENQAEEKVISFLGEFVKSGG